MSQPIILLNLNLRPLAKIKYKLKNMKIEYTEITEKTIFKSV